MLTPNDMLTLVMLGLTVLGATWAVMWKAAQVLASHRQLSDRVKRLERHRGIIPMRDDTEESESA